MAGLHPLLERHLTRQGILDLAAPPTVEEWYRFLERISKTYTEAETARAELERRLNAAAEAERAERQHAEAELQRLRRLCQSGMEQMTSHIQAGAESGDMLALLTSIRSEFERHNRSA